MPALASSQNGKIYLKTGSNGVVVSYIQKRLKSFNYTIKVDGIYGAGTTKIVKKFQKSKGLNPDGIIGSVTFVALMEGKADMLFDRKKKKLTIRPLHYALKAIPLEEIFKCKAVSGLPPAHKVTKKFIDNGREELNLEEDYTKPKFDNVSDVGPIPDGEYSLKLSPGMSFQKNGGGWGMGGWILTPPFWKRVGAKLNIARSGFFLHEDGNGVGTSGCIGVSHSNDMIVLKKMLIEYQKNHPNGSISINVI